MATNFTCPQGHRWEWPADQRIQEVGARVACPVCGMAVVVGLPMLALTQSTAGTERHAVGLSTLLGNEG